MRRDTMSTFPVLQESEGEWTSDKTVELLGLRIPAYFVPDPQLLHDFITGFQTKPDDVFVVSYPCLGSRNCLADLSQMCPIRGRGSQPRFNSA